MDLKELKIGESAIIERFHDHNIAMQLINFGLHEGSIIKKVGTAPFGSPIIIEFEQTLVAIRCENAANVQITPVRQSPANAS